MNAQLLDGKATAADIRHELTERVAKYGHVLKYPKHPHLSEDGDGDVR
ncbi:hypothetical protein ACF06X_06500 [Streptomyces sp. NPDC015346]